MSVMDCNALFLMSLKLDSNGLPCRTVSHGYGGQCSIILHVRDGLKWIVSSNYVHVGSFLMVHDGL